MVSAIIDGSNPQEEVSAVFPGDTLLTPLERRKGLPIGNQTSQFFANVYLNALDHFVLRELRPALYLRYVDDFVIVRRRISAWLGHAAFGDTWALRRKLFAGFILVGAGAAALRGGSWNNNTRNVRASNRNRNEPTNRNNNIGFRCAGDGETSRSRGFQFKEATGVRFHFRVAIRTPGQQACVEH